MDEQQKLMNWILKVAVSVLAAVIGVVVIVMCIGLFVPNDVIDNNKIFEMITPAFNTIIGAFVGLLGGLSMSKGDGKKQEEPPPAPPAEPVAPPPAPVVEEEHHDDGIDHSQPIPEEEHKDDNRWSDDHHEEHLADHVEKHS